MKLIQLAVASALVLWTLAAPAQEAAIRKSLTTHYPQLKAIDEVRKTPISGLYEVRINETEIFYTDEQGLYLIDGHLIDVRQKRDLTTERIDKLTAIDFRTLPFADAMVVVRGTGARKIAVFSDPNCGYCKRFEQDLLKLTDITVYTFLYPLLGPDSMEKSRNIWCAKEPVKAWLDWMVQGKPPRSTMCDSTALTRNVAYAKRQRINGTPNLIFPNGVKVPGALPLAQLEEQLQKNQ